ncbi:NAD(P)/FAD-dependent oxidoreductase [Acuticoccus sp. I52.16.1]|uniref:flavin monoamine oxidase family protein n=1 Tax=Acuticoccus sp. I52.16.1 TaxID=2928472 RepID=UPI001FD5B850|nr:NAD(P)/FAD-dependent oxidoreductase [Acuticoccus sp. I52.16.1]UOM36100.1 FAD-dependent oxidoreductase [Acuticoccus sp. I52.16.1]
MAHSLFSRRTQQLFGQALAGAPQRPRTGALTRRRVLQQMAAASVLAGSAPLAQARARGASVAVIGGGLAGLSAAWHPLAAGHEPVVYEASGRIGGRVRSMVGLVADGIVTEFGGQYISSDHADMIALSRTLGVPLVDVAANAAGIAAPETAYHFAGRRLDEAEVAHALAPLARQIADDAARLDADWAGLAPTLDARSVAEYLVWHKDKINAEALGLVAALIRAEYGVETGSTSVLGLIAALPAVTAGSVDLMSARDEMYMVEGGSEAIVHALARRLGDRIERGKRAAFIDAEGDGHRINFTDGSEVVVDATVLAIPFPAIGGMQVRVPVPRMLPAFAASVRLGRNEKVFAGFDRRAWQRPDGFALDLWSDAGASVMWDDGVRQPGHTNSGMTFLIGGAETRDIHRFGPEAFVADTLAGLARGFPGMAEAYNGLAGNTAWLRTPWLGGSYTNLGPGQKTRFAECFWTETASGGVDNAVMRDRLAFAGEQYSDAYYGYMNGGAQTGRLAAQAVAAALA